MYFVLLLSIFTAILTVRDNLILAAILFVIIIIIGFRQKKIKLSKRLLISSLAFFISIFSVRLRQSIYIPEITQNKIFGVAKITNIHDSDSYIIDYNNQNFFLETDKKFQLGDNVLIEGNIASGFTGNILDIQNQRKNLTKISAYKFSYTKRLVTKNIKGTIYPTNIVIQSKNKIGLISQVKTNLQSKVINSYGENRVSGLILGMLIGDKSILPVIDYENFRDSGLVHIIAVSGGNIVMIVVFLSFILFFLPFYIRIIVILFTIIFYALLCGLDSSVLRATIMGGLGLVALLAGRNMDKWRVLAIAYISMIVYNPYYLAYDIGFLFSFSAVIGIIIIDDYRKGTQMITEDKEKNVVINPPSASGYLLLQKGGQKKENVLLCDGKESRDKRGKGAGEEYNDETEDLLQKEKIATSLCSSQGQIYRNNKIERLIIYSRFLRKNISTYLIPSLGATIGIFPFMMFFVGKINLISIFGNLLILPIIPFVMIYGFFSVFLFDLTGRGFILFIEKILINYIFAISDLVSKWGIYLNIQGNRLKYVLVILFVAWIARRKVKD